MKCRCGGTGRRIRLKIVRETMWVRVPPSVPVLYINLYKISLLSFSLIHYGKWGEYTPFFMF